ncbi:MAG: acyl-CoA thioesterase [Planctomycetales bacterium]|nr:acyl-CoA thioesterase [Planctomycetales bacterium]
MSNSDLPAAEPMLRTIAMPADANPSGDIFGGWLLSQMDMAGGNAAMRRAGGRVVTVAIDAVNFHEPVEVGDELTCYAHVSHVGRTSMTIEIEAWKRRLDRQQRVKVTEAVFTYVKIDANRRPQPVPRGDDPPE